MDVGANTDFWRTTHYGFVRHSGHLYARDAAGDFTLSAWIDGAYRDQYDQAGLMVELDEQNWLKAGIEYVDGAPNISAVVTRGVSDWSRVQLPGLASPVAVRVERRGDALHARWSSDGQQWLDFRMAWFPPGQRVRAGVMAAAPKGGGFSVTFRDVVLCSSQDVS
jgi:hypothetical protein